MNFDKAHKMIDKNSEGQNVAKEKELKIAGQREDVVGPRQGDASRDLKKASGSCECSHGVSSKRKSGSPDSEAVFRTTEAVPSFRSKEVPRLLRNAASDQLQNAFKNKLAPPCAKKPIGVTVKKPRLDAETGADCKEAWTVDERRTSSATLTELDDVCSDDTSLVECVDLLSNESADPLNEDCSSDIISFQSDKERELETAENVASTNDVTTYAEDKDNAEAAIIEVPKECEDSSDKGKKVKIKVAPQTPRINDKEANILTSGFMTSFANVVHCCMGRKASSSPNMSTAHVLTPAAQYLDEAKVKSLVKIMESCPEGVDMKLSLFMSACAHDPRALKPFPESVLEDNDLNRHLLYYIAEEIPSVNMILFFLKENEPVSLRKELIPVVDWLIRSEDPRLELVREQEKRGLLERISTVHPETLPSKIFRLKAKRSNELEQFWQQVKGDSETVFLYHNCRVEQAHSLMSHGLNNHLTKNGVYGQGTYLTDNLDFCVDSCVPGNTWGKSSLGTKVKLVFVVELISNHSVLSYSGHGEPFNEEPALCEGANLPKYYFIKKPNLARLRYLMVYVLEPSVLPKNPFYCAPLRRKILKYLGILRISLLVATVLMGASASQRRIQPASWFLDTISSCYRKFSTEFLQWPIWKYVETPYIAIPIADSGPQTYTTLY